MGKTIALTWQPPHLMLPDTQIVSTTAYRVQGTSITVENWAKRVQVGVAFGPTTTIVDAKPLNKKAVTYVVVVDYSDGKRSGVSNAFTITFQ